MSDILDEAKRLLAEATPGPWTTSGLRNLTHIEHDATRNHIASMPKRNAADATLIARAPTLIAELVAMVEAERGRAVRAYGELIAIAHLAAPGRAWPYERVTSFLEKEASDGE